MSEPPAGAVRVAEAALTRFAGVGGAPLPGARTVVGALDRAGWITSPDEVARLRAVVDYANALSGAIYADLDPSMIREANDALSHNLDALDAAPEAGSTS